MHIYIYSIHKVEACVYIYIYMRIPLKRYKGWDQLKITMAASRGAFTIKQLKAQDFFTWSLISGYAISTNSIFSLASIFVSLSLYSLSSFTKLCLSLHQTTLLKSGGTWLTALLRPPFLPPSLAGLKPRSYCTVFCTLRETPRYLITGHERQRKNTVIGEILVLVNAQVNRNGTHFLYYCSF